MSIALDALAGTDLAAAAVTAWMAAAPRWSWTPRKAGIVVLDAALTLVTLLVLAAMRLS